MKDGRRASSRSARRCSRRSDYIYDFSFPEEDGKPNPHLWTDPTYAIKYARCIATRSVRTTQRTPAITQQNRKAFTDKATALADALRTDQQTVPDGNRQAADLPRRVRVLREGPTAGRSSAPSSRRTSRIRRPRRSRESSTRSKAENVPAIFGSEVFPSNVLEEIGNATGARYEDTLRDDDLPGEPGDPNTPGWA